MIKATEAPRNLKRHHDTYTGAQRNLWKPEGAYKEVWEILQEPLSNAQGKLEVEAPVKNAI